MTETPFRPRFYPSEWSRGGRRPTVLVDWNQIRNFQVLCDFITAAVGADDIDKFVCGVTVPLCLQ